MVSRFMEPNITEEDKLVLLQGTLNKGLDKWKNTLVGYFVNNNIDFKFVQYKITRMQNKIWLKVV